MYSLILAGGPGSRLGLGEKPLITLGGKPMIRYVISAFESAGCDVIVVLSRKTPYTHNWCRAHGIFHYTAGGRGYIEDIAEASGVLDIREAFFTSVADIPCLKEDIVHTIRSSYEKSGKSALSTWIPRSMAEKCGSRIPYMEVVDGVEACPAGINILKGDQMDGPQDEIRLVFNDPRLAYNINTREALSYVNGAIQLQRDW